MSATPVFISNPITLGTSEYTKTGKITATLYYPTATQVQFSHNDKQWSEWEPFAATKNFAIVSPADGVKKIMVRFRDEANNVSPEYSDSIKLATSVK